MSDAFYASIAPTIAALAALVFGWCDRKRMRKEITEVHIAVNSRMDALLALTKKSSHAEGVKDEKDKGK